MAPKDKHIVANANGKITQQQFYEQILSLRAEITGTRTDMNARLDGIITNQAVYGERIDVMRKDQDGLGTKFSDLDKRVDKLQLDSATGDKKWAALVVLISTALASLGSWLAGGR